MRTTIFLLIFSITASMFAQPSGKELMALIDKNLSAKTQVMSAKMVISGARGSRTIEFSSWAEGDKRAFTEYTSPSREQGTKMLKLEDKLWIFSPSTDRIIQISGQMLRQSVMGSDLSYEDMMNNSDLTSHYNASVSGTDTAQNRRCWILQLNALTGDEAYQVRRIWVDQERFVPLREELYAKSGKLLKRIELSEVARIQGRWYPMKIVYKDMLKSGEGTQFNIVTLKLDEQIPESTFSKASLK